MAAKISLNGASEYYYYKSDFICAYNANKYQINRIELSLSQVAQFRNVDKEHLRTVLRFLIKRLKNYKYSIN